MHWESPHIMANESLTLQNLQPLEIFYFLFPFKREIFSCNYNWIFPWFFSPNQNFPLPVQAFLQISIPKQTTNTNTRFMAIAPKKQMPEARTTDHHGLSLHQRPKNSIKTCLRKTLLVIDLHIWIKPLSCNMWSFFNWRKEKMHLGGERGWGKRKFEKDNLGILLITQGKYGSLVSF